MSKQSLFSKVFCENNRQPKGTVLSQTVAANTRAAPWTSVSQVPCSNDWLRSSNHDFNVNCEISNDKRVISPILLAEISLKLDARDTGGLGHDFRHAGTSVVTGDDGNLELLFNGSSALLSDFYIPGATFGYAAWIRPESNIGNVFSGEEQRRSFLNYGSFFVYNGQALDQSWYAFNVDTGVWTHVAVMWNQGNPLKAFKNGKQYTATTNVGTTWGFSYPMCFGSYQHGISGTNFTGRMRGITLFQKDIDETDVKRVMCSLKPF